MRKFFPFFLFPLFLMGMMNIFLAHAAAPNENAKVYRHDQTHNDLVIALNDLPIYILLNFNGSKCEFIQFPHNEPLNISIDPSTSITTIVKTNTSEACIGNSAIQIEDKFHTIDSIQNSVLRTVDSNGEFYESYFNDGCDNILNFIGQPVYFGTGLEDNMIFLPGGDGKCKHNRLPSI